MQHGDEVQIVVMRVRADGDSRTKCGVHKNDQELAKGHGYQILGRAKNSRRNKIIKSVRRANEAASNIVKRLIDSYGSSINH